MGNGGVGGILLVDLDGAAGQFLFQVVQNIAYGIHGGSHPYRFPQFAILEPDELTAVDLHRVDGRGLRCRVEKDFAIVLERIYPYLELCRYRRGHSQQRRIVELVAGGEYDGRVGIRDVRYRCRVGESRNPCLEHHLFPAAGNVGIVLVAGVTDLDGKRHGKWLAVGSEIVLVHQRVLVCERPVDLFLVRPYEGL